jgi:hypothetical protein
MQVLLLSDEKNMQIKSLLMGYSNQALPMFKGTLQNQILSQERLSYGLRQDIWLQFLQYHE